MRELELVFETILTKKTIVVSRYILARTRTDLSRHSNVMQIRDVCARACACLRTSPQLHVHLTTDDTFALLSR